MAWVRKHLPADGSVQLSDVTSSYGCFGLWGPRARDILAPLTRSDLGNQGFRYMTAREISVGNVPCLAVRVTYVGELGWELYFPSEYGQALWDLLWQAGAEHGMRACGYRAIDALRIEKGYRVWGSDMTPEETPDEAGLGFAVKPDKGDFKGREALLAARERPAERRLCCLLLADPALDLPRLRAGAGGRRGGRPRHHRRLRLRGRALDRLRLPAGGRCGRRLGRRGGGVRRVGGRRGRRRAAVGRGRRADQELTRPPLRRRPSRRAA